MTTEGIVRASLIRTIDKPETLATLRQWRYDSKDGTEVALITDLIALSDSGDLDG